MAKTKLEVGAEFEFLTKDELRQTLQGWLAEVARGIKFRGPSAQTTLGAGGVWVVGGLSAPGGAQGSDLGPREGFVWAVTGVAVSGAGIAAADTFSVYINEASPSKLFSSGILRDKQWDPGVLILNSGDKLAVGGTGTGTALGDVNVSVRCAEVPVQLAWQLI